jgi:hypothetical protein
MSVISTGLHPKALWPGIKAWWGRSYDQLPTEYTALFDMDTSEKAYEEDVEITGFGLAPVKPEGGSIAYDTESQGAITRYVHVAYALGYIVTYEELQDNLYEQVSKRRTEALAFSMKQTKEIVAANVYNRAFTAGYTFGDGQIMCCATHPSLAGSQSNVLPVAADLSEASLEDMTVLIMRAVNARGLRIALIGKTLIVPPQLWFEANRILKSTLQNDTGNNAINVLKETNALSGGIKMNHYLSDPDAWFVRTNAPRGLVGYQRAALTFDQDNDFDTKNAKAAAYERYTFGMTDWRGIYGSPGA